MRKIFTKIMCLTMAAATALGITVLSACSNNVKPLDYTSSNDAAVSNGGFAVEKGDYVYFINGKESNTADNTFGNVVKGAIMRISKKNLSSRRYSSAETVVPHIAYSGNYNTGIFVYGDYVYYATPSTEKNSDGEVQNSHLAFKSTKLDGTGTMKDYYVQNSNNSLEYRYVLGADGVVYLVYVATSEDYFDTGASYTNIHSVNTETGANTLLAYNVESYMFDSADTTNSRIYYTMKVSDFVLNTTSTYNQIWTVTADATTPNDYDFSDLGDDYKPEENPLYVNCGTLVFDGIGKKDVMGGGNGQFNGDDADKAENISYTYTLSSYSHKTMFYTRSSSLISTASLFAAKESEILASGWNPVTGNDSQKFILSDGSSASSYTYLFDKNDKIESVIIADGEGFIKTALNEDGEIVTEIDNETAYYITKDGQPTLLFTAEHNGKNYLYYSVSGKGNNGYSINRVCSGGNYSDYSANLLPVESSVDDYTPVTILDLDCSTDWYKPEMFEGQILFPTQTENMTEYVYVMACDLRDKESGEILSNAEIKKLNEQYESIEEQIAKVNEDDYENLQNALRYAFYTRDGEYIYDLCQAYVDVMGYKYNYYWSEESLAAYDAFMAAKEDGEWGKYSHTIGVNSKLVSANKRDYYYSVLGRMSDADAEAFDSLLKTTYLKDYPTVEKPWFEGLSTGAKVGFIIGVCAGGLLIIAAAAIVTLVIIRKRKEKLPDYTKKRIKVDTTDDKNIDVYADDSQN